MTRPVDLFHWDRGLWLTAADLAVDIPRRQKTAFVSHAHGDHSARHEFTLCTPETAALLRHRLGGQRLAREMPYGKTIAWAGLELSALPAGHCLGAAMLHASDGERSLLYTGDFRLGPSATSRTAELRHADTLIMECTFGSPAYRLPPRQTVIDALCETIRQCGREGVVPVVAAYAFGKSQEVTKILSEAGFFVFQEKTVYQISRVYDALGVSLGRYAEYRPTDVVHPGQVLIVPPGKRPRLGDRRAARIAVTGWAADPNARYRLRVDHAFPLSDHADYDQLIETARRVAPREIYCTHGPASFVDRLCEEGFNAKPLGRSHQMRLF